MTTLHRWLATGSALLAWGSVSGASAQLLSHTQVSTQTSLAVTCTEPGCDCVVNGVARLCPGTDVQNYDSGSLPGPTSHAYSPTASGQLIGFDSHSSVNAEVDGSATFGTLHSYSSGSASAGGLYALAGGLVSPTTSNAYTSTSFDDQLTVTGPPGQSIAITFTHVVSALTTLSVGTGSGVDPCLANAAGTVQLNANLIAFSLTTSASGQAPFARSGRLGGVDGGCDPLHDVVGSPIQSFTLTLQAGETVNFGQILQTTSSTRMDGGLGGPGHPNRVLDVLSTLDAGSSGKLYIDVLTPGGGYTTASGTVYRTPEPGILAGLIPSLLGVATLARRRRRI